MSIKQRIALWLANGETGLSSKTIAFYLGFGIIPKRASHPEDVGDFSRCVQHAYDQIKDRKGKMVDGVFVKEEDL